MRLELESRLDRSADAGDGAEPQTQSVAIRGFDVAAVDTQ